MNKIVFDRSKSREVCSAKGVPVVDHIARTFKAERDRGGVGRTLLAVCPNSEAVLRASLVAAGEAHAPIKFAATLNQVDLDGGYTGWTQEEFVRLTARYVEELDLRAPVIIAMDHGGPWLKDVQAKEGWPLDECMMALKTSLTAAIFAGYDLLHIDPTVDRTLPAGVNISIETVVARTIDLIGHVEGVRRRNRLPVVSYEVGTEEVHGGLADMATFRRFLDGLRSGLLSRGLPDVWPIFVVGKVGTDLHTTTFDPAVARELVAAAGEYGSFIKGHYTDFVANPEEYPRTGMGAANIGPEFTEAEYEALVELEAREAALRAGGLAVAPSDFRQVLAGAVLESGRWMKWRQGEELNLPFERYAPERREWLVKTGCRYIWTVPAVLAARRRLYDNLSRAGIDADRAVLDRIGRAVMQYYRAFNLVDVNEVI